MWTFGGNYYRGEHWRNEGGPNFVLYDEIVDSDGDDVQTNKILKLGKMCCMAVF